MRNISDLAIQLHTSKRLLYVIKHLLYVAGVDIEISSISVSPGLSVSIKIANKILEFKLFNNSEIEKLISGSMQVGSISNNNYYKSVPIFYTKGEVYALTEGDKLIIYAEILTISFLLLSRFEECLVEDRDEHGRFQFKDSLAAKYDFVDWPVVDVYAMLLVPYFKQLFPNNLFKSVRKTTIIPTHDIDIIYRFPSLFSSFKTCFGDLIKKRNPIMFFRSLFEWSKSFINPKNDPYLRSIEKFIAVSSQNNLSSEFYFMAAEKSEFNSGYSISADALKPIRTKILQAGMTIGFHGGYDTLTDNIKLRNELDYIQDAFSVKINHTRQHYLRYNVQHTHIFHESLGITYDSTLGFAEREGFRCGTCHEYNPYNFSEDRPFNIVERPLIVMESTLQTYRQLSIKEAYAIVTKLFTRCQAVGGNFIILWHNDSVTREPRWFNEVYVKFLNDHK